VLPAQVGPIRNAGVGALLVVRLDQNAGAADPQKVREQSWRLLGQEKFNLTPNEPAVIDA
jgi:hypothetical protein